MVSRTIQSFDGYRPSFFFDTERRGKFFLNSFVEQKLIMTDEVNDFVIWYFSS